MHKKWVDLFVDPDDRRPLELQSTRSEGEHVIEGWLISKKGKTRYPIANGIPRFVPLELYDEREAINSDVTQTGRSFGDLWRTDTNRHIGVVEAEYESLEEQFLAMLGVSNRKDLARLFEKGVNCLNAGCGVGWSEYLFNENRDVNRIDVDLSLAVESAYHNTRHINNVVVAQADIFALPFRNNYFDIIFSNGVLHHTKNAKNAFGTLCRHLRPGGLIGIYVYNVKPFVRELADKEIRRSTSHMTFEECWRFSKSLAKLGKSFTKYREALVIEEDIPMLGIKRGRYDLQKFIYDHFVKCFYNERLGDEYSALVNVDWYHPQYASHHTQEEVTSWYRKNGIGCIKITGVRGWEHSGFFVSGRKTQA